MKPEEKTEDKLMNFYEALKELFENNKKITRLEWNSNEEYGFLFEDGALGIHHLDEDHIWKVRDVDAIETDWFLLPEDD